MPNPFQRLDTDLRSAAIDLHTVLETSLTSVANAVEAARVEYEELNVTVARIEQELLALSARSNEREARLEQRLDDVQAELRALRNGQENAG